MPDYNDDGEELYQHWKNLLTKCGVVQFPDGKSQYAKGLFCTLKPGHTVDHCALEILGQPTWPKKISSHVAALEKALGLGE